MSATADHAEAEALREAAMAVMEMLVDRFGDNSEFAVQAVALVVAGLVNTARWPPEEAMQRFTEMVQLFSSLPRETAQ